MRAPQGFCLRSGSVSNRTYRVCGCPVRFQTEPTGPGVILVRFQTEPTGPGVILVRFQTEPTGLRAVWFGF